MSESRSWRLGDEHGMKIRGSWKKGGGDTNASLVSVDCETQMGPQSCVACSAERHSPSRLLPTSHLLFGCFHTSPVWSNSSSFARKGHCSVWGGVNAKSKWSRRIKEANSGTPKSSDLSQIQAGQKQEVGRALQVNKTWSNVSEASCPALTEASCSLLVLFSYFLLRLFRVRLTKRSVKAKSGWSWMLKLQVNQVYQAMRCENNLTYHYKQNLKT